MDYTKIVQEEDYLEHHGIKGQKWGIRRYQNADGSLTEEGRRRYDIKEAKIKAKAEKAVAKANLKSTKLSVKAEKLAAKNLKKATKEQEKLMKMEMKAAKKEAAYARGKAFGESFASSFGRGFGQQFGEGIGKTFGDWQKWKELKNTAYANETSRMEKELAKRKYDSGFEWAKFQNDWNKTMNDKTKNEAAYIDARAKYNKEVNAYNKAEREWAKYLKHLKDLEQQGGNP